MGKSNPSDVIVGLGCCAVASVLMMVILCGGLGLVAVGISSISSSSNNTESILGRKVVRKNLQGWVSSEDYNQCLQYVAAGDLEGFGNFMTEGLAAGRCVDFVVGEVVYVNDVSVMMGAVKARREEGTQEYWVPIECVQP